jgi:CPA1 family monovalent cation:H+ antiporter
MRGLVTLATAFVLPADFPQRDLIVLTAFAVVLATLVVQGLTLAPLVRMLGLDGEDGLAAELAQARADLVAAALATLKQETGPTADHWRFALDTVRQSVRPGGNPSRLAERRRLGLLAMRRQRLRLEQLRLEQRIGPDAFAILQEELDFSEVALTTECERQIAEN